MESRARSQAKPRKRYLLKQWPPEVAVTEPNLVQSSGGRGDDQVEVTHRGPTHTLEFCGSVPIHPRDGSASRNRNSMQDGSRILARSRPCYLRHSCKVASDSSSFGARKVPVDLPQPYRLDDRSQGPTRISQGDARVDTRLLDSKPFTFRGDRSTSEKSPPT